MAKQNQTSLNSENKTNIPENILEAHNVSKRYARYGSVGGNQALREVSLSVPKGEIFGFLGPNGAGKTTLIKLLIGVMTPDSGRCQIMGADSSTREAKLKLGYLPERPYFHEFLNAGEFLRFHGRLLGLDDEVISSRVDPVLDRVGLKKAKGKRLRTFSKGMLQRVGIAQALIHNPEVLILDEPMSGLDPVGRREIRDIITEIATQGKTIFFSTHIIPDVEVICTTVGFINEGKLKGLGNIENLLGKTIQSMEIRFSLPTLSPTQEASVLKSLKSPVKKTMDGWVLEVERAAENLETEVNRILRILLDEKGVVRGVIPRKSTLEDLFFKSGGGA